MAAATSFANIEKLTESNYELWKIQMKSVLVFNEMWQYVDGTEVKPLANAQEWIKKDSKALALINLSITHGQLNHVKKAVTSKGAWDGLKAIYESRGPVRKAALYKQLLRMEKKPNIAMTQYITDFTRKAEQLEEAGIDIPEELLVIMLLGSLPVEFENFCVAIESRDQIPTLENLKIKLMEEEARQQDRTAKTSEDNNNNDALLTKGRFERSRHAFKPKDNARANINKFVGKCYNCGKNGHMSRHCKSKPKRNESNDERNAMTAIACNADIIKKSQTWCLDSGATRHMSNDERIFSNLNKDSQLKVYTAGEQFIKSNGVGDININAKINRYVTNPVKLKNALCVPGLRNNLLSVSSATDNGFTVTFEKDRALVKRRNGSVVLTATKRNKLYVVNEKEDHAAFVTQNENTDLRKWHQRYGHLNINDLKAMINKDMVLGIKCATKSNDINCEVCAKCKINAQTFKSSLNREENILGLVHSDICGPMSTESLGGAKYFVTFIDDCSRYTEAIMLRNRSDVLQAFKDYKRRVENQTGQRIKKLRTDNGREYLSKDFNNYLREEGIQRQLSVEYTPQQNGVAERANRTLVEMARCMMLQANLPDSLWAEAVNAAAHIRNRSATKSLNGITPIEAWSQRKPYVGYFRTIGSKTIALNKRQKGRKFQPKGDEYVLVGYSDESKAYRLWKPGTKTVIKARDVKFFERIEHVQASTSRTIFTVPDSFVEKLNEETEQQNEDANDEMRDDESVGDSQASERDEYELRRAAGRPKLMRTGKPGRPRKIYISSEIQRSDPSTTSQIMRQDDKEE